MRELTVSEFTEVITYMSALMIVIMINTMLYLRAKKIILVQHFFRVQILVGIWMIAKIFKVIAPTLDDMWLWVLVEYIGVCFFAVEFLVFAYIFKMKKDMKRWLHGLIFIGALFNYTMLFTNEYHNLFFSEVYKIHSIKGPIFYVHMSYSYILIAIGIFYLFTTNFNREYKVLERIFVISSMMIPIFVNVAYVFDWFNIPFDLTPITMNILMLGFGIAAFRNNYFDVQMMTRYMILENLYEGVIILDKDTRVMEFNEKMVMLTESFVKLKKYNKFEEIFSEFENVIVDYKQVVDRYKHFIYSTTTQGTQEIEFFYDKKHEFYLMSMQKTFSIQGEYTGTIIKYIDITESRLLSIELEEKNTSLMQINDTLNNNISVKKRLYVEQERNRVSKEVHDILGHSVTLVISLLEMIRQTYEKEPDFAKEKIIQAMEITRRGLSELKKSLTKKKVATINIETLIEDLERLTEEFSLSGVDVEFITNHYNIAIRPKYYDTIYRICQESMTNALRHGQASKITIAVRFSEHSVDIIIADNGMGCENFTMGNGLKGMEQRVHDLEGFFSCGSPDGEGFNLHVTIPIAREMLNINDMRSIDE